MPKLPVIGERAVLKVLKKAGFNFSSQTGSHATYRHPDTKSRVTIPLHRGKDFKTGTLRHIVRQSGLTVEKFIELMK